MRAPLRTGLLALLCALLLGIATIANANIPGRPIDRPEGPPEIDPTMVGDPDAGNEIIVVIYQGKMLAIRLPWARHWLKAPAAVRHKALMLRPSAVGRR